VEDLRFVDGNPHHRLAQTYAKILQLIKYPPKAIIFAPWFVHGGADLVASHAIRALADLHEPQYILLVLTDFDKQEAPHLLPASIQVISLLREEADLTLEERARLVDLLIRSLQPSAILNVNSHACWEAIKIYGKRLSMFSRLYGMLFCPDYSADGRRSGYSDLYLRHCLPFVSALYFDNRSHIDEVIEQFGIPEGLRSRLVTLRQPAPSIHFEGRSRLQLKPFRVLWAGRLVRQKNIELLMEIIRHAPDFEFHVWGRGDHANEEKLRLLAVDMPNLIYHGPFNQFADLPLASYNVLLYTSLWDGLPNILLEAAAANLPIVASAVGGVHELVDEETGWLITQAQDWSQYVRALELVSDNGKESQKRTKAMRKRLLKNHTWQTYVTILQSYPLSTGGLLDA
jgi:glycosyltransferase involved in cell wall biosynthesis